MRPEIAPVDSTYSRRTVILTHAYFYLTVVLTQQQRTLPSLFAGLPASPEEGEGEELLSHTNHHDHDYRATVA
eukprot:scaffold9503_cov86-Skeletonema_menzelii.AAC.1